MAAIRPEMEDFIEDAVPRSQLPRLPGNLALIVYRVQTT